MKVSGIDPAPRRGLQVFDGTDHQIKLEESAAFLADLARDDDHLVCWDAPLTGPPSWVVEGAAAEGSAFCQRPLESFFGRASTGFKAPPGISVQGYAGCPHWALTRSLLGLPRVGRFDGKAESLPFRPMTSDSQRPERGRCIVEVHPAVALWLWCRDERGDAASGLYKSSLVCKADRDKLVLEIWESLLRVRAFAGTFPPTLRDPGTDDELDARVAYALGRLWLDDPAEVSFLGDADTGGFLLPRVPGMEERFRSFVESLAK